MLRRFVPQFGRWDRGAVRVKLFGRLLEREVGGLPY